MKTMYQIMGDVLGIASKEIEATAKRGTPVYTVYKLLNSDIPRRDKKIKLNAMNITSAQADYYWEHWLGDINYNKHTFALLAFESIRYDYQHTSVRNSEFI